MNAIAQGLSAQAGYGQNRNWLAKIDLAYQGRKDKTVLSDMRFEGPLRVQRPFYPEGQCCHTYLLHPPGGMVSGDKVEIAVSVEAGAHALLTTPSAGKIYKADSAGLEQTQNLNIKVSDGVCEWLPQETILFNQANARFRSSFRLQGKSVLTAWEMMSLGRLAGSHLFQSGSLSQSTEITLDDRVVVWEAFQLDAELNMLSSRVGLNGFSQFGNLYWVGAGVEKYRDHLDVVLEAANTAGAENQLVVASHKPDVLVVRGFGHSAEALRNTFIEIWAGMRERVIGNSPCHPRIWST